MDPIWSIEVIIFNPNVIIPLGDYLSDFYTFMRKVMLEYYRKERYDNDLAESNIEIYFSEKTPDVLKQIFVLEENLKGTFRHQNTPDIRIEIKYLKNKGVASSKNSLDKIARGYKLSLQQAAYLIKRKIFAGMEVQVQVQTPHCVSDIVTAYVPEE